MLHEAATQEKMASRLICDGLDITQEVQFWHYLFILDIYPSVSDAGGR